MHDLKLYLLLAKPGLDVQKSKLEGSEHKSVSKY